MASLPTFNAGSEPGASNWQTLLPVFVRKTVDQSVTSNTTLATDSVLFSPTLAAGSIWDLDMMLLYRAGGAASANGIKFTFVVSGGGGISWVPYSKIDTDGTNSAAAVWVVQRAAGDTVNSGGDGGQTLGAHIRGSVVMSGAGVVSFQWAQATSSATATVVAATSCMTLRQVA